METTLSSHHITVKGDGENESRNVRARNTNTERISRKMITKALHADTIPRRPTGIHLNVSKTLWRHTVLVNLSVSESEYELSCLLMDFQDVRPYVNA
eukprot:8518801-Pyramimonas_sp.AAC.1